MNLKEQLRSMGPQLSVGAISANMMALGEDIDILENAGVKLLHFDIMDGCFVPMLTVGPSFVKSVRTSMFKDVHLEINEPLDKIADYVAAGADIITVHPDSCRHIHRVLQRIGELPNVNDPARRILRGIALNPSTPISLLEPLMGDVDLICLVAVNPGFSGQKFIPATSQRIAKVKELIKTSGADCLFMLDGGITRDNVEEIASFKANVIVTGSAVFDNKQPTENIKLLTTALRK